MSQKVLTGSGWDEGLRAEGGTIFLFRCREWVLSVDSIVRESWSEEGEVVSVDRVRRVAWNEEEASAWRPGENIN